MIVALSRIVELVSRSINIGGVDISKVGPLTIFETSSRPHVRMLQIVRGTCYDVATLVLKLALLKDTSVQP
jgi:hypothetical protein